MQVQNRSSRNFPAFLSQIGILCGNEIPNKIEFNYFFLKSFTNSLLPIWIFRSNHGFETFGCRFWIVIVTTFVNGKLFQDCRRSVKCWPQSFSFQNAAFGCQQLHISKVLWHLFPDVDFHLKITFLSKGFKFELLFRILPLNKPE